MRSPPRPCAVNICEDPAFKQVTFRCGGGVRTFLSALPASLNFVKTARPAPSASQAAHLTSSALLTSRLLLSRLTPPGVSHHCAPRSRPPWLSAEASTSLLGSLLEGGQSQGRAVLAQPFLYAASLTCSLSCCVYICVHFPNLT